MRLSPTFLVVLLLIFVLLTGGAAIGAYTFTRQFVAEAPIQLPQLPGLNEGQRPTAPPIVAQVNATAIPFDAATAQPMQAVVAQAVTATTPAQPIVAATNPPPNADMLTRVNILVLGIDQRKGETGSFRTDTMIVLSLDPLRKTGVILSVPRDIYMQIPGTQVKSRINTAYDIGGQINYPGGAAMLSVRTIQTVLGIKIHHYIVVNFDVFDAAINAIGPIKVCPTSVIHDAAYPDNNYGYLTVHFDPGCQELDATKLLQYSRVRHNAGDDFGRASRQQEVIKAVRDKVLSLGGIGTLITKAGDLWGTVKTSVQTDMTFDQMLQLAQIAQAVPRENIASGVLTDRDNYILPATTAQGEQVYTPNYEKIHTLIEELFSAKPGSAPAAPVIAPTQAPTVAAKVNPANVAINPTATPFVQVNATVINPAIATVQTTPTIENTNGVIQVLNGSGVAGIGKNTVDLLKGKGFNVMDTAKNADVNSGLYALSVVRVYNGQTATARKLVAFYGIDPGVIKIASGGPIGVDIEFIVGLDIAKRK